MGKGHSRLVTLLGAAALAAGGLVGCVSARRQAEVDIPSGWPIPASKVTVTSIFGAPRGRGRHQGIDLAAHRGTAVRATAGGTVTLADRSGDFGRLVVIDHGGGWETRYAHLRSIAVKAGKPVRRGDEVGSVGHSGNATGDHLHYEVRHAGVPVDPWPTLHR